MVQFLFGSLYHINLYIDVHHIKKGQMSLLEDLFTAPSSSNSHDLSGSFFLIGAFC